MTSLTKKFSRIFSLKLLSKNLWFKFDVFQGEMVHIFLKNEPLRSDSVMVSEMVKKCQYYANILQYNSIIKLYMILKVSNEYYKNN